MIGINDSRTNCFKLRKDFDLPEPVVFSEVMAFESIIQIREVLHKELLKLSGCLELNEREIDGPNHFLVVNVYGNLGIRQRRINNRIVAGDEKFLADMTLEKGISVHTVHKDHVDLAFSQSFDDARGGSVSNFVSRVVFRGQPNTAALRVIGG